MQDGDLAERVPRQRGPCPGVVVQAHLTAHDDAVLVVVLARPEELGALVELDHRRRLGEAGERGVIDVAEQRLAGERVAAGWGWNVIED